MYFKISLMCLFQEMKTTLEEVHTQISVVVFFLMKFGAHMSSISGQRKTDISKKQSEREIERKNRQMYQECVVRTMKIAQIFFPFFKFHSKHCVCCFFLFFPLGCLNGTCHDINCHFSHKPIFTRHS